MSDATPLDDAQLADSVLPAGGDPFDLFEEWFAAAQVGEINDPNATALATATADAASGTWTRAVGKRMPTYHGGSVTRR